MTLHVRPIAHGDVPTCVDLINRIIATGGTTAHENPFDVPGFTAHYIERADITHVVLHAGTVVGFQTASDVGGGVYSIGSFTDRDLRVRGAGRALFETTRDACRARGALAIIAEITEDNAPGLAYYTRMGFADWEVRPKDATRNGVPIDRIVKRYPFAGE